VLAIWWRPRAQLISRPLAFPHLRPLDGYPAAKRTKPAEQLEATPQHFAPWQQHYTVPHLQSNPYIPGAIPNIMSYRPSPPPPVKFGGGSVLGGDESPRVSSWLPAGRKWGPVDNIPAVAARRTPSPVSPSSPTPSSTGGSDTESVHHLDELAAACASARQTDLQTELSQVRAQLAAAQQELRVAYAQLAVQQQQQQQQPPAGAAASFPGRITMTAISPEAAQRTMLASSPAARSRVHAVAHGVHEYVVGVLS